MAPVYEEAPELAPAQPLPEVYHPQPQGQDVWSPQHSTVGSAYGGNSTPKPEGSQYYDENHNLTGGVSGFATGSQYQPAPQSINPEGSRMKGKRVVCGCSLVVFVLALIIAFLAAAVVGLAAGTGVVASNYNDANSKLDALKESYSSLQATATGNSGTKTKTTTVTATASATDAANTPTLSELTNGCSDKNERTTGSTYNANFFDKSTFTMYCNANAPGDPIYSLFTESFDGCMEACNEWNAYNSTTDNCSGLSFIPGWGTVAGGVKANAPGSCYLKTGSIPSSEIGDATDCHAALIKT